MRILVALSGGVDSAVTAALLQKAKNEVISVHLRLFDTGQSMKEIESARAVAAKLKIPFYVLDFRREFKKEVVDYFLKTYAQGLTPNPCIFCNPAIKFGKLLTKMRELKCDQLATGHYAQIEKSKNIYKLLRGADPDKDQSYFLCRLNQAQLSKVIFPIGDKKKTEVRKIAKKIGLSAQEEKKESAGVCFLPEIETPDFLRKNLPQDLLRPGAIKTFDGKVVGKHPGIYLYTIGQRRGVDLGGMPEPYYVIGFERASNELIVGPDRELYATKLNAKQLSWISTPPKDGTTLLAQIRYRAPAITGTIQLKKTSASFEFKNPIRAITPGQAIAFYHREECLGGGIIQ